MNDELEAIRTRHNEVIPPVGFSVSLRDGQQAHADRATLLALVDRMEAALAPFAEMANHLGEVVENDNRQMWTPVSHLYAVRAALKSEAV